jgi:DNA invertase Pin-like site-specific DNA recombinase
MLAVFAEFNSDILRDRVRAGIAQASKEGRAARTTHDNEVGVAGQGACPESQQK